MQKHLMNRRHFFGSALVGTTAAGMAASARANDKESQLLEKDISEAIATIPLFCAHEHWGSIDAMGMSAYGFRTDCEAGAVPRREVSVWDLVLDPYFGGWISTAGHDVAAFARKAGCSDPFQWWRNAPQAMLDRMLPVIREQRLTGGFQCLRRGILALHQADLGTDDLQAWKKADAGIAAAYADIFEWYREAMTRVHFSDLIRPIHPEFFYDREAKADDEESFTKTLLRVDPLLTLWPAQCPRRDRLAELTGVEPRDAVSWRAFITALFDHAARKGNLGIKQLQAYSRDLDYVPRSDAETRFSGDLTPTERRCFEDWVMHECCKQAHERHWPHQIHVGTHNLPRSSPLPLGALASRYPNMRLVLLHCWPYIEESAYLAKLRPQVYLDACWQVILNPAFLEQSLDAWLGYVPITKIMCSQDATSVEMAAGASLLVRETLSRALAARHRQGIAETPALFAMAEDILHNNAGRVYGLLAE
ncbi:MAG TPA: amidohydrolase family protein [Sedimentisphaerales bacterium]|jgi:predicted TIM-barrel fold metal-dependent hydrolase|nr:amidohydrolase family protein [Sedimentisphaerales bacterium]HNU27676.1 amidohydrolase family protein [Sedimentisphaerales bacterium]